MDSDVIFKMRSVILAALGGNPLGKLGILEKCVICSSLKKHPLHGQIQFNSEDNSNCKIYVKGRKTKRDFFFFLLNTSSVYHAVQII